MFACSKFVFLVLLMELFKFENTRRQVVLKISDFDEMSPHDYTVTGTIAYMAPEVLVEERFSESSDVWRSDILILNLDSPVISHLHFPVFSYFLSQLGAVYWQRGV